MSEVELISINVWLGGRSYRIRIHPGEEEAVRKAVKLADEKVIEMRSQYAGKDDQDFLAMVLLTYAADGAVDAASNPLLKTEIGKMIRNIDAVLGEAH